MDCIDCHNRPTHIYKMPDEEMDHALVAGRIDTTLPYIKKLGVEALTAAADKGTILAIDEGVHAFYKEKYPALHLGKRKEIEAAITAMRAMFSRNVFPKMKVTWGTYASNIGHERFPGCFRCHDDEHTSADGRMIRQDCEICHTVLAWDEEDPEILSQLGIQ